VASMPLADALVPVDVAYGQGFEAGMSEGRRIAKPVVVPIRTSSDCLGALASE
jgi:hypothetical protein